MMQVPTKYCRYCGRLLKNKESIQRGYGMSCYLKHIESLKNGGLLGRFKRNKNENQHMAVQGLSGEILQEQSETGLG